MDRKSKNLKRLMEYHRALAAEIDYDAYKKDEEALVALLEPDVGDIEKIVFALEKIDSEHPGPVFQPYNSDASGRVLVCNARQASEKRYVELQVIEAGEDASAKISAADKAKPDDQQTLLAEIKTAFESATHLDSLQKQLPPNTGLSKTTEEILASCDAMVVGKLVRPVLEANAAVLEAFGCQLRDPERLPASIDLLKDLGSLDSAVASSRVGQANDIEDLKQAYVAMSAVAHALVSNSQPSAEDCISLKDSFEVSVTKKMPLLQSFGVKVPLEFSASLEKLSHKCVASFFDEAKGKVAGLLSVTMSDQEAEFYHGNLYHKLSSSPP